MISIGIFNEPFWYRPKTLELLNVLRDDGMSYGAYVEQLTYLLFFKMAYKDQLLV